MCPFHSPEAAVFFQFKSMLSCFVGFGLEFERFTLWQDEVAEMFQIFLECISGLQNFDDNFFPDPQVAP